MTNNKVLILEGGYNEEHEVSLNSSKEIQKILKKLMIKYNVLRVNQKNFEKKISKFKNHICFNALHGPFGEDGQIQKILKRNKIRFTHSGIKSSKLCFDKYASKRIIKKNKILTPKFTLLTNNDLNEKNLKHIKRIYKKFVIKPSKSGSSFGITIIKNNKDLKLLFNKLDIFKKKLKHHKDILIEEFIPGKELTVSTIKNSNIIQALAVTEIKFKNNFFDYQAKYSKGFSKHILPANIIKKNYLKCLKLAIKSHLLLGCRSVARSDFILSTKNNKIYYLETNTQPGLTSVSLLPEQCRYRNITFEEIILTILKNIN